MPEPRTPRTTSRKPGSARCAPSPLPPCCGHAAAAASKEAVMRAANSWEMIVIASRSAGMSPPSAPGRRFARCRTRRSTSGWPTRRFPRIVRSAVSAMAAPRRAGRCGRPSVPAPCLTPSEGCGAADAIRRIVPPGSHHEVAAGLKGRGASRAHDRGDAAGAPTHAAHGRRSGDRHRAGAVAGLPCACRGCRPRRLLRGWSHLPAHLASAQGDRARRGRGPRAQHLRGLPDRPAG